MTVKIISAKLDGLKAVATIITITSCEGKGIFISGAARKMNDDIERICWAFFNCNLDCIDKQLRIEIEPVSSVRGNSLDLAIAVGILIVTGWLERIDNIEDYFIVGGLGVTGAVHEVAGLQSICRLAKENSFKGIIMPRTNIERSKFTYPLPVYPVRHIIELVTFFKRGYTLGKRDCPPELFERFFYN